jgi:class 3 adenylate cyclase
MLKDVSEISRRLNLDLHCRIGMHTGCVRSAVVGAMLPRYFLFGKDMRVTSHLEVTGMASIGMLDDL